MRSLVCCLLLMAWGVAQGAAYEPPPIPNPMIPLEGQSVVVKPELWPVSTADQHFHLYLPAGAPVVKGLFLFLFHGAGQQLSELPAMRALADELHCGVVGFDKSYDYPHRGVPTVILQKALAGMAAASAHPEIVNAPICPFGHSNGTYTAAGFATTMPERTFGWIAWKSANGGQFSFPPMYTIPGLVVSGDLDKQYCSNQLETVRRLRWHEHALMNYVLEPGASHGTNGVKSYGIVLAFMKTAFLLRVPADADPTTGPVALKAIKEADGWLGQNRDSVRLWNETTHSAEWQQPVDFTRPLEIAPFADYPGDAGYACWLPTEDYARKWQTFCVTGDIPDWDTVQPPVAATLADKLAQAQRLEASDALAAEAGYKRLVADHPGTPEATQAAARLQDPAFVAARKAWAYLRTMWDAEMALQYTVPFMHVTFPMDAEFYATNKEPLATMKTAAAALQAEYPDSPAAAKAQLMLVRYKLVAAPATP